MVLRHVLQGDCRDQGDRVWSTACTRQLKAIPVINTSFQSSTQNDAVGTVKKG